MDSLTIAGTAVFPPKTQNILEKIKKYMSDPQGMMHIVSLNPEILVAAAKDEEFRKVIETAQIQVVDGVGVVLAGLLLYGVRLPRNTGTHLMESVLTYAGKHRLRVLLIGGKQKIAESIAECYSQTYSNSKYLGVYGIEDIKHPQPEEEERIFSIVADMKPHFVFVSFGSPDQELWIARNSRHFQGMVCAGVGGAFDYIAGVVPRAPMIVRSVGLEWLYRLIRQPWRARRQINLFRFIILIAIQRLSIGDSRLR